MLCVPVIRIAASWQRAVLRYALCVALVFTCAASPDALAQQSSEHEITGLWHTAGFRIEFRADGTYVAHTGGRKITGFWAVVDSEYLATWTDSARPRRVNRFAIHGKHLLIAQSGGKTVVHTRLPATVDLR